MRARAQIKETHAAVVVLLGDHVFKLKKPVDLGFLDFSTREARRAVCRQEVGLNRRLAPDVYEGVADVIGPDGEPCEHLVVMRRMPDDRDRPDHQSRQLRPHREGNVRLCHDRRHQRGQGVSHRRGTNPAGRL